MRQQIYLIISLMLIVFACTWAPAETIERVVIDENGHGSFIDAFSETHTFDGQFMADPSGGRNFALVYTTMLFTFSVQGDYQIYTPNTEELVGVVRFYGNNTLIFYDNDVGTYPSIADGSGMPLNTMPYLLGLDQTFVGDPVSGTVVTPRDGMAGYYDGNRQYTFLSIYPVPEPGTLAFLLSSVALVALRRRHPRR
jgi:PEP-CTERM motif